ncbi:MAG: hypothetical protein MRZ79_02965 [Bacteroidia bacterium]|nr:hypothetical protein [Bacteroidia bacterium]
MKHLQITFTVLLALLISTSTQAQLTRGIVGTGNLEINDATTELFGSRKRKEARTRNERLREQNLRLERQVEILDARLNRCMQDNVYSRYPRKRKRYNYNSLSQDFWGENKLQKEYDMLKEENIFLRDQVSWYQNQINQCEGSYRDDRNRDRGRNDRGRTPCNCKKGKKKYKDYPRKRDCDD